MVPHPRTLVGGPLDWEPVSYGIRVLRAAPAMSEQQLAQGVRHARALLAAHARRHHIAVDSIREHHTAGSVIVYFEGVKVLHAQAAARLAAALREGRRA